MSRDAKDSQWSDLCQVGVTELLENDDRPTFVVDLDAPAESNPVFYNSRLVSNKGLKDRVHGLIHLYDLKETNRTGADWKFLQWQRSVGIDGKVRPHRDHPFADIPFKGIQTHLDMRPCGG